MLTVLLARGKFSLKVLDGIYYLCDLFADPKTRFLFTVDTEMYRHGAES